MGDGTVDNHWQASGGRQIGRARIATEPKHHWPGRVDDVRLYTGALDKERISSLYKAYPDTSGTPAVPAAGAGHWKFDEGTGTTVADSSPNARTATMKGGLGWIGGRTGNSSWLDGTSGYAETTGPVLDNSKSFSATAWVYMPSGDRAQTILSQDGNRVGAFSLYYDLGTKKWATVLTSADQDNATGTPLFSSIQAATNDWTHLGVVYDVTLRQVRLDVNGPLFAAQVGPVSAGRPVDRWRSAVASGTAPT